jgi:phage shock protein PspC (stress-responsive transcriptional regulator)
MNKTINVNIGGRIFSIEEEAYQQLEKYLKALRSSFSGNQSADEIIADIESRISELFGERINESKQVIVLADVDAVIGIMGKPEDYIDEEEIDEESNFSRKGKYEKRVFRDPDNKLLFGVCSGLSAYLGWDPIILRAIFVLTTLAWGTGPLIYIILALIIPKAKTTAEKLQMRGEPVTVDNISKKVNESFTGMKDDIKDFGKKHDISGERVNSAGKQVGDVISDFFEALGKVLQIALVVIGKIIGVAFLIAGAFGLMMLVTTLVGVDSFIDNIGNREVQEIMGNIFADPSKKNLLLWGTILVIGMPMLAILLVGIRLLVTRIKYSGVLALGIVLLWITGMGLVAASGVDIFQSSYQSTRYVQTLPMDIDPSIDTLTLDIQGAELPRIRFEQTFMDGSIFLEGGVTIPWVDSTNIMFVGRNRITVKQAAGKTFLLEVEKSANGSSEKEALMNARDMVSSWSLNSDSLRLSPYFILKKGSKLRSQRSEYILHVPVGKALHFAPRSEDIINDIPNVTNTYDRDMIGKTWLMTEQGLECTTCLKENNDKEETGEDESTSAEIS